MDGNAGLCKWIAILTAKSHLHAFTMYTEISMRCPTVTTSREEYRIIQAFARECPMFPAQKYTLSFVCAMADARVSR